MSPPPEKLRCLVFDLGAGSGRAMIGAWGGDRLTLTEIHRFDDLALSLPDGPHWDVPGLKRQILEGLRLAALAGGRIDAIGIDSWGVDYALLDGAGEPVVTPHHYRHPRSQRGRDAFPLEPSEAFAITGAQDLAVNTIYQLFDEARHFPDRHAKADALLMMADLVNHFLTGEKRCNVTLARTTGLLDIAAGTWSDGLRARLGLPRHLLQPIALPGEICGRLRPELAAPLGWADVPVIAVAAHDTASAVAALPLDDGSAFLILGSWSLIGIEQAAPSLGEPVRLSGFGNEGGTEGRSILVKSLNGLHLIQKLRASWRQQTGEDVDYAAMSVRAAAAAEAGTALEIDPSDPCFFNPEDMVAAIADHCARTGREMPQGIGALALAIYRGMAAEIAATLTRLEQEIGSSIPALRVCGGGGQDAGFCAFLAEVLQRPVVVGPIEASSWGNAMLQLVGLGAIPSVREGRALIARSTECRTFLPA
jgi:rhamnulokinase